MSNEPVAWVLEWSFNGEEVGRRIYDDETHCKFDAGQDGGVCRPLIYGDTHTAPDDTALLRQALTTLDGWANHGDWVWPESALEQAKRNTEETITALRERLGEKT